MIQQFNVIAVLKMRMIVATVVGGTPMINKLLCRICVHVCDSKDDGQLIALLHYTPSH